MPNDSARTDSPQRPGGARSKPRRKATPAYFLSLTVENVRCFGPRQTLDLSDGHGRPARWTVILGDNGVGKTTLLQCLAELRPALGPPQVDGQLTLVRNHGIGDLFSSLFWRDQDRAEITSRMSLRSRFDSRQLAIKQLGVSLHRLNFGVMAKPLADNPAKFPDPICYGYGAARRLSQETLSGGDPIDVTASLFSDNAALRNGVEWLLQAEFMARKRSPIRKAARKRVKDIKSVLINLLPDVSDIRFPAPADVRTKPSVEFRTPYGWVPIGALGLGYRAMISWTIDLSSRLFDRYPDSPDPIAEPGVVLVDEIDLHLHPSWQRNIMGYLSERFRNTQFIVTTHSPLIVQAATDANIVLLRRAGDHVVIENDVKAVEGWRVDQVLTSDLFVLESARPPRHDALMQERERLLSKPRLPKADKARLNVIAKTVVGTGVGETPMEMEALNLLRRAALAYKTPRKVQ